MGIDVTTDTSANPTPKSGFKEDKLVFLQAQIECATSHLQIADAKAGGTIAFVAILVGHTSGGLGTSVGNSVTLWSRALIASGLTAAIVALIAAFAVLLPRGWKGRDSTDPFSWVGLSNSANEDPYPDRIESLTARDMHRALADTAETLSLVIRRKYSLVTVGVWATLIATILLGVSWFLD